MVSGLVRCEIEWCLMGRVENDVAMVDFVLPSDARVGCVDGTLGSGVADDSQIYR
jgi:hypothetical protein